MKKCLVVLLATVLAAALASGCSNDRSSSLPPDQSDSGSQSAASESESADVSENEGADTSESSDTAAVSSEISDVGDGISDGDPAQTPDNSDVDSGDGDSSGLADTRAQIVNTAQALVGIDFVYDMADPQYGFDNSGLIYYVLRENGYINCPRSTAAQKNMGTAISLDDIRPGDIVFFTDTDDETGESYDFGGIYIGDGQLIYSPYPGEKVKYADINGLYWSQRFSTAVSVS